MKEYEQRPPDSTEQDAPQGSLPMKSRRSSSSSGEHLSHPANAEPLADLLGQLQHDYGNAYVQRVVSGLKDERADGGPPARDAAPQPESVQSLDSATRGEMESAFGESLGDVRLHTGEQAEEAARGLDARAFTRGRDIYFGKGEYDPSTRDGKELLAHELTHVIQQQGGTSETQSSSLGRAGDSFEQEADRAATAVLSGQHPQVANRSGTPAVQRQNTGRTLTHIGTITQPLTPMTELPLIIRSFTVRILLMPLPHADIDSIRLIIPRGVIMENVIALTNMNIQAPHGRVTGPAAPLIGISHQGTSLRMIMFNLIMGNEVATVILLIPATASPGAPAPGPAPGPAPPPPAATPRRI